MLHFTQRHYQLAKYIREGFADGTFPDKKISDLQAAKQVVKDFRDIQSDIKLMKEQDAG